MVDSSQWQKCNTCYKLSTFVDVRGFVIILVTFASFNNTHRSTSVEDNSLKSHVFCKLKYLQEGISIVIFNKEQYKTGLLYSVESCSATKMQ